jgi:flagellar FliL protein
MADQDASREDGDKVQLDDFESSLEEESSSRKVELDLDDAPFLEWDEEEQEEDEDEELPEPEPETDADQQAEERPWWRRGWCIFLLAATLAIVAGLIYYLFFHTEISRTPAQKEPQTRQKSFQELLDQPVRTDLEPFLVEFTDGGQGQKSFRYLHFACALYTKDREVIAELGSRKTDLREAVFDYLQSKDGLPLSDKTNMDQLKNGLLQAVNQRLEAGGFDEVMIQEYVVY